MRRELLKATAYVMHRAGRLLMRAGNWALLRQAKLCGCDRCAFVIEVQEAAVRARTWKPERRAN